MSPPPPPLDRRPIFAALLIILSTLSAPARGGPINSDAAFSPRRGGSLLRLQYSYSEADSSGAIQHLNRSGATGTFVYGLREDLALFLTVPYANRQVDRVVPRLGRIEDAHDGIGDITVMAKYRFWQNDTRPGETYRWAALGGLNVRSGDSDFSSNSYDPIVGTVFSWQRDRGHFDADLIYQVNTGRGDFPHDVLRYDLVYTYRLFPAVFDSDNLSELGAVAELNGRYTADGSHELFLSPGLQFRTEQWVLEVSIQLPAIQHFAHDGPETDYRLVLGLRFQW